MEVVETRSVQLEGEMSVEAQMQVGLENLPSENNKEGLTVSESEKLASLVAEYEKIQNSAQDEITKKRSHIRAKCQERLWMAAVWRDYQLEIVQKSFEVEMKQVEKDFQSEFNGLKESLMQELLEEKKRLEALEKEAGADGELSPAVLERSNTLLAVFGLAKNGGPGEEMTPVLEESTATGAARRLRKREEKPIGPSTGASGENNNGGALLTAVTSSRRKQPVNNVFNYNTLLNEQEILDDIGVLSKDSVGMQRRSGTKNLSAASSNAMETSITRKDPYQVSIEGGTLHYNWDIIKPDDIVKVNFPGNGNSSVPTWHQIQSISPTEIVLMPTKKIGSTGKVLRVALQDLRSGKVLLLVAENLDEQMMERL